MIVILILNIKLIKHTNNFHIKIELERQNSVCSNFIKNNYIALDIVDDDEVNKIEISDDEEI